jgi:hypothetical protein
VSVCVVHTCMCVHMYGGVMYPRTQFKWIVWCPYFSVCRFEGLLLPSTETQAPDMTAGKTLVLSAANGT